MPFHDQPILPNGFRCASRNCGLKPQAQDLALFVSDVDAAAAAEIGTTADRLLVSSTGVIGLQLPIELIERGIRGMSAELQRDPLVGAEGIMTTDTDAKALWASVGRRDPRDRRGQRVAFDDANVRRTLTADTVDLDIELGAGDGASTAYGCDLSRGSVDGNSAYYSS